MDATDYFSFPAIAVGSKQVNSLKRLRAENGHAETKLEFWQHFITARRYASAVYLVIVSVRRRSVRPSVRPSHKE